MKKADYRKMYRSDGDIVEYGLLYDCPENHYMNAPEVDPNVLDQIIATLKAHGITEFKVNLQLPT